ncbi:MAG TPA: MBL fold metallo-hydrolase [Agromyces sp.]|jgi:glyoxylase-like metal-dependent hydrolase (beta-lactamase superfamily II)
MQLSRLRHADDEAVSPLATLVRAPNPGPMTLDGTNSFVLRSADSPSVIVVDPGPSDAAHLERLASYGQVELVLLTHHHADHSEALSEFAELTGAPVRAVDRAFCIGAEPLVDGERITAAGVELDVVATPGHTSDSVCFALPNDDDHGTIVTGDTVLGRGTTIIADPDGALGPYLASLERLLAHGRAAGGPVAVLPGHGPVLRDLASVCDDYLAHRALRLDQVRAALRKLGDDASVEAVTDVVYADTDASVRFAAEASVRAQLAYLRGEGR